MPRYDNIPYVITAFGNGPKYLTPFLPDTWVLVSVGSRPAWSRVPLKANPQ